MYRSGLVYRHCVQWANLNSLSTGSAPAAMKGFVATIAGTGVPSCGGAWTTDTGNSSSPPPATNIPAFIGVIVAGKITQNGSVLSGDISHIVIVKTDAGYGNNPGHSGTGTVVGLYC